MAKLLVITRSPKTEPDDWTVVGQTTDKDRAAQIARGANNNSQFVKKADGSILGDKSNVEIFDKDDFSAAFNQTVNLDD